MEQINRVLSHVTAKPRRRQDFDASEKPCLDENGHIKFTPNDGDNPQNWSPARRWYITLVTVSMAMVATFASSAPSGCIRVTPPLPAFAASC